MWEIVDNYARPHFDIKPFKCIQKRLLKTDPLYVRKLRKIPQKPRYSIINREARVTWDLWDLCICYELSLFTACFIYKRLIS